MCDTLTQMRSGVGLELYETTQCVNLFGYIFYRHFRLRAGGIRSGSGCPKTRSCPDRGRREVGAASKQCNSCADLQNPYRPILEHVIWQLKIYGRTITESLNPYLRNFESSEILQVPSRLRWPRRTSSQGRASAAARLPAKRAHRPFALLGKMHRTWLNYCIIAA